MKVTLLILSREYLMFIVRDINKEKYYSHITDKTSINAYKQQKESNNMVPTTSLVCLGMMFLEIRDSNN